MSRTHCVYAAAYVWYACIAYCVGSTQCRHTRLMLHHNQNGFLTFLVNFKPSNLNKETKNSMRMIS